MNSALDLLKKEKPELYRTFTQALTEDLGLISGKSVSTFTCPGCNSTFQIVVAERQVQTKPRAARSRKPVAQKKSPMESPLFAALVDLAKLRRARTGDVNAEFKKVMKNRIKKMDKKQARAVKIEWLRKEIAKARSKAA